LNRRGGNLGDAVVVESDAEDHSRELVMHSRSVVLAIVASAACQSAPAAQDGPAQKSPNPRPRSDRVEVETLARGLEHPWGLALLPDGRFLVTERPGRVRIVSRDGRLSPALAGVPEVQASGQGGALDITLDPQFAQNRTVYLSFAEPGPGGAGTAVARARLTESALENLRVIYRQEPKVRGGGHFGSRVVFRNDGTIFVTQGDRQGYQQRAQDLSQGIGKIVRINPDGTIPRDNPFVNRADARPEIWSYGHRNVQAAALHPETGALWTVEHGARGGDELNHPEAGKNYGWPVITYGRDYSGARIGEGVEKEGMEQPVYYWDPIIAPSGMVFYTGDAFPGWKGSVLIGGLASESLVRLTFDGDRVASEERFAIDERVRDVQQGADGLIYLITDSGSGRILRVRPKSGP
jgi:glucose/arabinose dehydrogenase